MGFSIAYAAALAALAVQSAVPGQPIALEPSGPWTVEYADSMCIVGRKFGVGDQEVTLGFRPGPMSEHMRIALWFPDDSETYAFGAATLAFDDQAPLEERFGRGPTQIKGVHLLKIDTVRQKIGTLNATKLIQIRAGDRRWTLKLGGTEAAMKALSQCERDLLVKWGMDPAVIDSIETPPMLPGGLVSIFRVSDYPEDAILQNKQGTTGVRFWIGTNGKVTDCEVVETSGHSRLDGRTCGVITRRARYVPAKTKSGEPVPSFGFQRVRWEVWR